MEIVLYVCIAVYVHMSILVSMQYQFLNMKQRRHELVVLELYETHTNQSQYVITKA